MLNYIFRRVVYGFLVLVGVNILTFVLFFAVNTPDDMARMNIGGKRVTADAIEKWKTARGYDKRTLAWLLGVDCHLVAGRLQNLAHLLCPALEHASAFAVLNRGRLAAARGCGRRGRGLDSRLCSRLGHLRSHPCAQVCLCA
jgi:hypothetical protein